MNAIRKGGNPAPPSFPTVLWGTTQATFLPAPSSITAFPTQDNSRHTTMSSPSPSQGEGRGEVLFPIGDAGLPAEAPVRAALVFALQNAHFVVADIAGRGWCIPGGRLESGETPEQAVHREAWEECGATLGPLRLLGHYVLTEEVDGSVSLVPTYLATVTRLDPLPSHTESRGVRLMQPDELPTHYFLWDPLIAAVFTYAFDQATKAE